MGKRRFAARVNIGFGVLLGALLCAFALSGCAATAYEIARQNALDECRANPNVDAQLRCQDRVGAQRP